MALKVVSYKTLGQLERGHGNPTLQTIFELCRALNVTVADVLNVEPKGGRYVHLDDRDAKAPKRGRKPARRRKAG